MQLVVLSSWSRSTCTGWCFPLTVLPECVKRPVFAFKDFMLPNRRTVFHEGTCSPIHSERSNTTLSAWHSIIGFVHLLDYIDAFLLLSFTEILQSTFKRKAQLSCISNGYDNNNIKIYSQYHHLIIIIISSSWECPTIRKER